MKKVIAFIILSPILFIMGITYGPIIIAVRIFEWAADELFEINQ